MQLLPLEVAERCESGASDERRRGAAGEVARDSFPGPLKVQIVDCISQDARRGAVPESRQG